MIPVLRDYQRRDLDRLREAFRAGARAVLYQAPTGSGKTVLFADIVRGAAARNNPVWIIVHRQELVDQTSRALTALSVPHGIIAAGRYRSTDSAVLVCSIQSLARRIGQLPAPALLVLDEAHHSVASTWDKAIGACNGSRILGVTATPERLDGRGLGRNFGGHFDSLVIGPGVEELTSQGHLAPAKVFIPPQVADLHGLAMGGGDFAVGAAALRMDKATVTGDAIQHYERLCPGAPAIVFCTRIQHAMNVAAAFREKGWRAEPIDGTLADNVRRHRIAALGDGRLQILTSCEIVSEGTDIPIVTAAILLRPTESLGMFLQQVGRVLRPAPGKAHAVILDHVGNCLRHGFPDDERDWSLTGRPKRARGDDAAVAVRVCPACFAAFRPAAICPYCGTPYPVTEREIEQVSGQLVEATEADKAALGQTRRKEVYRARDRDSLVRIAKERGYKPGWADYVLAAREKNKTSRAIDRRGQISTWKGDSPR